MSESPSPTMPASTQLQSELTGKFHSIYLEPPNWNLSTAIEEIESQCINYDAASSPLSDLPESTSPKHSELDDPQLFSGAST